MCIPSVSNFPPATRLWFSQLYLLIPEGADVTDAPSLQELLSHSDCFLPNAPSMQYPLGQGLKTLKAISKTLILKRLLCDLLMKDLCNSLNDMVEHALTAFILGSCGEVIIVRTLFTF